MGGRVASYRAALRDLAARGDDLAEYLAAHSGLPGPRGNIELGMAAAEELSPGVLQRLAGSEDEFEAFCGTLGLGRLVADGRRDLLPALRARAADGRWRVREAAAMALQRWGDVDVSAMLDEAAAWARDGRLEQRAAAAGTCEPRLLGDRAIVRRVLAILDEITGTVAGAPDRRTDEFRTLRRPSRCAGGPPPARRCPSRCAGGPPPATPR